VPIATVIHAVERVIGTHQADFTEPLNGPGPVVSAVALVPDSVVVEIASEYRGTSRDEIPIDDSRLLNLCFPRLQRMKLAGAAWLLDCPQQSGETTMMIRMAMPDHSCRQLGGRGSDGVEVLQKNRGGETRVEQY